MSDSLLALRKEGLAERVEIAELSRVDGGGLVEAAVGSQVNGATRVGWIPLL